jgi:predicted metal-binding membrane protein
MFGVGGIHLGWMLVLGVIMLIEKAVTWGRWITRPVGDPGPFGGVALLLRVPGVLWPFQRLRCCPFHGRGGFPQPPITQKE